MSRHHARVGKRSQGRFRQEVLIRDGYRCQSCGKLGGRLESHHVVPLEEDGEHHADNGQTLCRDCHFDAHRPRAIDPERLAWQKVLTEISQST